MTVTESTEMDVLHPVLWNQGTFATEEVRFQQTCAKR